ncbi:MAG: class I SAM-dependent methyltransferase [Deltaproteobacteria bacterium]|nr:class I SAM-dependent methyltransferase [Deltaproteobacteria bacterium]
MKIFADTDKNTMLVNENGAEREIDLNGKEAFGILSRLWIKSGWVQKYSYTFTWMGRPIIQLPEDMVRTAEVIYRIKPDVIVETGVAHGGSLIFYASLCRLMGKGRVIGVDIEVRPHNRAAIEAHELSPLISLIIGSSVEKSTADAVKALIKPGETVMVLLDSCHEKDHVAAELLAYQGLVTQGSYIVATDGIMSELWDVPNGRPHWKTENPTAAAAEFAAKHPEFVLEEPPWSFNESKLDKNITYWPGAWLRRI